MVFEKKGGSIFLKLFVFFFQNFEPTNSILASFLLNHRGRCVWRRHVIIIIINSWYYSCLSSIFFLVVSYLGLDFFFVKSISQKKKFLVVVVERGRLGIICIAI